MAIKKCVFVLSLALVLVSAAACRRRVWVSNCTTPGNICVSGGIGISFSTTPGYDASQFVITREASPTELSYQGGPATYTVTVRLNNGAVVAYQGYLVRNTSRESSFLPFTPGHRVYAFVPANPASLQAFINQYRSRAVSADVDTTVALVDISNGTDPSAEVDVQGESGGNRDYLGSIRAGLPRWREGPPEV